MSPLVNPPDVSGQTFRSFDVTSAYYAGRPNRLLEAVIVCTQALDGFDAEECALVIDALVATTGGPEPTVPAEPSPSRVSSPANKATTDTGLWPPMGAAS